MTERKWTKGPWVRGKNYRSIISVNETGYDDDISVSVYGGSLVCESVKMDANAHLIAAAPDLYEALDHMVKLHYNEAAYTALAKARGESQ